MPSDHALISPSALHRILLCPGSVALSKDIPSTSSPAADEGTLAHELLEALLSGARKRLPKGTDPEMADDVRSCATWITDFAERLDALIHTEVPLPIGRALGIPDPEVIWGTSDVVLAGEKDLVVIDFKYGRTPVAAEGNSQLLAYALGAQYAFPAMRKRRVRLVIVQPRVEGIVSIWAPTAADLIEFKTRLTLAVEDALSPERVLLPGDDQCQWCPAAGVCPALHAHGLAEFEDLDVAAAPSLDNEVLASLLSRKKALLKVLEAVETEATRRAMSGSRIPGWKLVESITRRAWVKDFGALHQELELSGLPIDLLAPPTLVSPAQAEKLLGKQELPILNRFIVKPAGRPVLAPESDKRPALAAGEFDDLGDLEGVDTE